MCPNKVYPAKHISDLRRLLEGKNQKKPAKPE
jgi:hypothetical protein